MPDASNFSLPAQIEKSISRYDKLICSIGVFIPTYGFDHIANAVEVIRQESKTDIGLLLIDGSFASDESYKSKMLKHREWITVLENVPHGQVFQILKKSDVFVVGDTPLDVQCGKEARVKSIAMATGHYTLFELKKHNPDFAFQDFSETDKIVQAIHKDLILRPIG